MLIMESIGVGLTFCLTVFSCLPVVSVMFMLFLSFAFFFGQKATQWGESPPTYCLYMPSKDRIEFHVLVTELLMLSTCVAVIFHLLCGLSFALKYQPSNCFSNNRIIYA